MTETPVETMARQDYEKLGEEWVARQRLPLSHLASFLAGTRAASAELDRALTELRALRAAAGAKGCFECEAPLIGPFCPRCNPGAAMALRGNRPPREG